jgi:nucleoside-diphosphate-sugar epimerase
MTIRLLVTDFYSVVFEITLNPEISNSSARILFASGESPLNPSARIRSIARENAGKLSSENACVQHAISHGYSCSVARCFAFVGAGLPAHYAAAEFLRQAARGGPIKVTGGGVTLRSYMHAADLAIWLWTLLFSAQSGRAYNVGSDHAISLGNLALLLGNITGNPVEITGTTVAAVAPDPISTTRLPL